MALYETVSGQVRLDKWSEYKVLCIELLLPAIRDTGINSELSLIAEVGQFGHFLDIFRYEDYADYERKRGALRKHSKMIEYHSKVQACLHGSIVVELMQARE